MPANGGLGGGEPWISSWWPQAGVPIVLRVPRGMAVVVMLAVLGVVILSYFVGYTQGNAGGGQQAEGQPWINNQGTMRRAPGGVGDAQGGEQAAAAGRIYGLTEPDPRQPGMNYLILARYPHDEAHRLATFVAEYGLDLAIIPSDNARLFFVVALRGFESGEIGAGTPGEAFREEVGNIGRAWRRHNNNRGDALETRYFARYSGR